MTFTVDRLAQTGRWRRRAAGEKALLALGLLILAVALPPWPGAALVLLSAWALALFGAHVPAGDWLRLNLLPLGFVLTGAAALLVEVDGAGLHLAADSGRAALGVVLRAGAGCSALLLLAATTPAPDLVRGARRLGLPKELAEIMLLTWNFLFVLLEQASVLRAAQEARLGWAGARRQVRSLGLLIAQLLPRALDRARRMEIGLAARGFDGALPVLSQSAPASVPVLAAILAGHLLLAGVALWLG